MNRFIFAVICLFAITSLLAVGADAPVASPFDKGDPEMRELNQLDWQKVDFDAQDLKTRCTSLMAMERVLKMLGGKSDARIELLVDYLDQQKLGQTFIAQQGQLPEPRQVSYEDGRKVAVALVQGRGKLSALNAEFDGCDDNMLKSYLSMYDKSSRRAFAEVIESRHNVRALALFVEKQGKFDDFSKWATAERDRRQLAHAEAMKEKQLRAVQTDIRGKAAADRAAAERRRQQKEEATKQMEVAMQSQQRAVAAPQDGSAQGDAGNNTSENYWYGTAAWPWTGMYYADNGYREQVRDKLQDSMGNWRPRPTPAQRGARR
jgi:hypothetical protein